MHLEDHRERVRSLARIDSRYVVALLVAVGLVVRVAPVLWVGAPINGGGLYVEFSRQVAAQGFAYPTHVPHYSADGLPFAYPPLAFYVAAVTAELLPVTLYDFFKFAPALLSVLTIPLFHRLATRTLRERWWALAATALYSVSPAAFGDFLPGDGYVEVVGTLLFLLFVVAAYRSFVDEWDWRAVLATGVLFGLCTLTSPGAALGGAVTLFLAAVFLRRHSLRARAGAVVVVSLVGAVVSAPWWAHMLLVYGPEVLLNGVSSKGGSLLAPVARLMTLRVPVGPGVFLGGFAVVGAVTKAASRKLFLPAWLFALIAAPEVVYLAAIPLILLAAEGLRAAVVPGIRSQVDSRSVGRAVAAGFVVAIVVYHVGMVGMLTLDDGFDYQNSVTAQDERAISWAQTETDARSTFYVVDDAPAVRDYGTKWLLDWFPALAQRTTLNVMMGSEWTGRMDELWDLTLSLRAANGPEDVERLAERRGHDVDYLYVVKGDYNEQFVTRLRDKCRVGYENSRVVVFDVQRCVG